MRKPTVVFALLAMCSFAISIATAAYGAASQQAHESLDYVNAARAAHKLPALKWNDHLASVAITHSEDMARDGQLYHNQDLANSVDGWSRLGENVGVGQSVEQIDVALMQSQSHRENILGDYTDIGIGVIADVDGNLWLTQDFAAYTPRYTPHVNRTPRAPVHRAAVARRHVAAPAAAHVPVARPAKRTSPMSARAPRYTGVPHTVGHYIRYR